MKKEADWEIDGAVEVDGECLFVEVILAINSGMTEIIKDSMREKWVFFSDWGAD